MIFQTLFENSQCSEIWKLSIICLVLKPGAPGGRSNSRSDRTIAFTCVTCRIFETKLGESINNFLDYNKLINVSQHGCVNGKITLTCIYEMQNHVMDLLEQGLEIKGVWYDKVKHSKILAALDAHGIPEDEVHA